MPGVYAELLRLSGELHTRLCGRFVTLSVVARVTAGDQISQVDFPPRDFGVTWSSVSLAADSNVRQYWQVNPSRTMIPLRETV